MVINSSFRRKALFSRRSSPAERLQLGFAERAAYGLCGTATLLLALAAASTAGAATIDVDGTICTLANAITAANTDTVTGGCSAGSSGRDVLNLQANVKLTAALPTISSPITIQGNGYTILRDDVSGAIPAFSILRLNDAGNLILDRATLKNGWLYSGGGIYNDDGTVTIINSTVSGNKADYEGGGIANFGGEVTVTNSTLSDNRTVGFGSGGKGGGIYNDRGTLTVTNSTLSGNISGSYGWLGDGGGIANVGGAVTVTSSTLSANTASRHGGGIYHDSPGQWLVLRRSIVSGNAGGNNVAPGQEIHNAGGEVDAYQDNLLGHSGLPSYYAFTDIGLSSIIATSDGNYPTALASILETTLAYHGGPTQTHALVAGSPAIDKIPITDPACVPDTTLDQRGFPRAGGADNGGSACDIGAYEYNSGMMANNLVILTGTTKVTNPEPDSNYPALSLSGVYTLTGDFKIISGVRLKNVFFKVVTLTGNNYLLNADGQPGQTGAKLSVANADLPGGNQQWDENETLTQEFRIGLNTLDRFSFYVDVYGEPLTAMLSTLQAGVNSAEKAIFLGRVYFEASTADLALPREKRLPRGSSGRKIKPTD